MVLLYSSTLPILLSLDPSSTLRRAQRSSVRCSVGCMVAHSPTLHPSSRLPFHLHLRLRLRLQLQPQGQLSLAVPRLPLLPVCFPRLCRAPDCSANLHTAQPSKFDTVTNRAEGLRLQNLSQQKKPPVKVQPV